VRFLPRRNKRLKRRLKDHDVRIGQLESLLRLRCGVPIPPRHLQERVAGDYFPEFFDQGAALLGDLARALESVGEPLGSHARTLDFGCGCGRMLIPATMRYDPSRLHGSDIDAEAIGWLRTYYPCFGSLTVNDPEPPLPFDEGSFDLVYSVSIMTHLPEDMQFRWLAELRRVTRPGGLLALTVLSGDFLPNRADFRTEFGARGFLYLRDTSTPGLPEFYRASYHSREYVRARWAEHFEIVDIKERGLNAHQDIVLLRSPASP